MQIKVCRSVRLHSIIWPDKLQEQPQQLALLWLFAALRTPTIARGDSFRIKRISPRAPQRKILGGWRRHKLPIPRLVAADCISLEGTSGAFSLLPSQLLFPAQTNEVFAPGTLSLRAPAHAFRCSSFSHRKRCDGLRREPCAFPPDAPLETTKGRARALRWALRGTKDGSGVPAVLPGSLPGSGTRLGMAW